MADQKRKVPITAHRGEALQVFSAPTVDWFLSCVGEPTKVQEEAWPVIASGRDILVSAPTGTGKTLSAFLVFIDRMKKEAREGSLSQQLQLIYISPLKSLAGDIRENLRRPLDGISSGEDAESSHGCALETPIEVAIRTGDTTQSERRYMVKHPPHILITTPESLYLLLNSKSGQGILKTAKAIIIDELHALIDTKRGAHLMFSLARLDKLCGQNLQRIGLSATIEPLETAAQYLSFIEESPLRYAQGNSRAVIIAPVMSKKIQIRITGPMPMIGKRRKDPVWEEVGKLVYQRCQGCQSVIAFTEGRRYAEKLAYYVNQVGGEGFARVHHGSLSKEQRDETEIALREGKLRLLCATSSMELGLDVGEIDQVLQIGCPRTISSTMQRLGRAGHNPGRVSVMYMYPRTAPESLYCGMTAEVARQGGVEYAKPPRMCLDVLAQHLVSMAMDEGYCVEDVMELVRRTYCFRDVTSQDVESVLCMLSGDYEHSREIPVRPRILYDRIHGQVRGDAYSRMLAVHAGGTIPDKGLYTVKNEEGVKLGELDEEFVYESRLGDTFLLGSFAWRIVRQDKDTVVVTQASVDGARMPFWKGEIKGRALGTSLKFGRIMRGLAHAADQGTLLETLLNMGLDEAAGENTADFLKRQIASTGVLPDDRTILVEHFTNQNGIHQVMVHSLFGRQVNAPLSILVQHAAKAGGKSPDRSEGDLCSVENIGCVDEEDGFLLYPYGDSVLPEGLLYAVDAHRAREILEAVLPQTPVFSMNFRYNSARALMMGMKLGGRQPLWMQRLRSTQMMELLLAYPDHPLIRETKRECLEENWDIEGLSMILQKIQSGAIAVREVYTEVPSPMSLPFQWQIEAAEMYEYSPSTSGIHHAVYDELKKIDQIKPSLKELERLKKRQGLPVDEAQLHGLLMMEGDLLAGELDIAPKFFLSLAETGRAVYIEPGLWIAAEHREEYEQALVEGKSQDVKALSHILRRMLYYRGAQSQEEIAERYFLEPSLIQEVLEQLCQTEDVAEDAGLYYHGKLYDQARTATVRGLRAQAVTQPPAKYAAMLAERSHSNASSEEQLKQTLLRFLGRRFPVSYWEHILLPQRVRHYSPAMLDRMLAQGEFFWQMTEDGDLYFQKYEEVDWDQELPGGQLSLEPDEQILYQEMKKRGASFLQALSGVPVVGSVQEVLVSLARKGLVCADSFVPVRQWQDQDKLKKATVRQRVNVRVKSLSAGRWDIVHPVRAKGMEALLEQLFQEHILLCRETFRESALSMEGFLPKEELTWVKALELLSMWELTGRVRRGYFIKGLSGAQFIRKQEYSLLEVRNGQVPMENPHGCVQENDLADCEIQWFHAVDPDQAYGRVLEHREGCGFLLVPGTAAALKDGIPAAVMERQGKILRIFEEGDALKIMNAFVGAFRGSALFPAQKRLIVKEYPADMGSVMKQAGFIKEMQDYVLYR